MSSLKFDARRPAHPCCQPFQAQQETHMYTIKRILISALIAGLVCVGEAALFAAGDFRGGAAAVGHRALYGSESGPAPDVARLY
jgi:hypothetical protein